MRYLKTLHERFHVYVDAEGVLRTDHAIRYLGLPVMRLHYKMVPARRQASAAAESERLEGVRHANVRLEAGVARGSACRRLFGRRDRGIGATGDGDARVARRDEHSGLPARETLARDVPDLDLWDAEGHRMRLEDKIEWARRAEAAALEADARVRNSEGAEFYDRQGRVAYASSGGFAGGFRVSTFALSGPVLGLFAEKDTFVTPQVAREVHAAVLKAGKHSEIHIYPNVDHAFFNDERPDVHHPAAAADAWRRTLAFFRQHLK